MPVPATLRGICAAAALFAAVAAVPCAAAERGRFGFGEAGWRGVPPVTGVIRLRHHRRPAVFGRRGFRAAALRRRAFRPFASGRGGRFGFGYGRGYAYAGGGFGAPGLYGGVGPYGRPDGYGTTATQSVYGTGPGAAYLSERPLAVRYAEPPLGPSPYAAYSPADRYADPPAPRRLRPVYRLVAPPPCTCEAEGALLPYGIGTAY